MIEATTTMKEKKMMVEKKRKQRRRRRRRIEHEGKKTKGDMGGVKFKGRAWAMKKKTCLKVWFGLS